MCQRFVAGRKRPDRRQFGGANRFVLAGLGACLVLLSACVVSLVSGCEPPESRINPDQVAAIAAAYGNQRFNNVVAQKPIGVTPMNVVVVRSTTDVPKSPWNSGLDFSHIDAHRLAYLFWLVTGGYFRPRVAEFRVVTHDVLSQGNLGGADLLGRLDRRYGRKHHLNVYVINRHKKNAGRAHINRPLGNHKHSSFFVTASPKFDPAKGRHSWTGWQTYAHELGHVLGMHHTIDPALRHNVRRNYNDGPNNRCGLSFSYISYALRNRPVVDPWGREYCDRANLMAKDNHGSCNTQFFTADQDMGNKFKAMLMCWNFRSFY